MQALIFPKQFSGDETSLAELLLEGFDNAEAQLLLDEAAGRLAIKGSKIHNPIGYLRSLISAYHRNEFTPEIALTVQHNRAYRKQVAEAVRYSNELAEQKALEFLGLK